MIGGYVARRASWVLAATLVGGISVGSLTAEPAAGGDLKSLDTSLEFVPGNVAFYSSMLRNREQIEIIGKSRAWAKLMAMPAVQDALKMYEAEGNKPDSPVAKVQARLKHPMVTDLLALLGDMFSHDVFMFADEDFVEFIDLFQTVANTMRYGPMVMQVSGQADAMHSEKIQGGLLFRVLAENLESIKIPTSITGFKVTDTDRAKQNLGNLTGVIRGLITTASVFAPQLYGSVSEQEIAGHEYLTISLNGEMIPWDEVPLDELEEVELEEGDAEKVIGKLKELKLVIAIGLRDDYLLLSIGGSTDLLARLGSGDLLVDRPELKPLEEYVDEPLTSVAYVSQAMNACVATGKKDIDELLELVEEVLPHSGLSADEQDEIRRDAAELAEDIKRYLPEPGAIMGFSFLTDRGMEGYSYNWTKNVLFDSSKPLTLLENTGGDPLLALVMRERPSAEEDYDLIAKWITVAYRYFEKYAVPQMPPREREKYEQFVELVRPLPARLDKANRQMLIPALADGQSGLVLDGKLKIRRFIEELPGEGPMPMIEPALVVGISDAELFRQGCAEYRAVFNAVVDALHEVEPDEIPDFECPEPKTRKTNLGTIYSYPLPAEWGIDKKIVPNAGLSEDAAVFSVSLAHTRRLLTATPLATGGVLTDPTRPTAVAFLLDWAGLVDAATPWVELAATEIIKEEMGVSADSPEAAAVMDQVHTVLEVLKTLRTVTAESYLQDGAMITHSLTEIRDVD